MLYKHIICFPNVPCDISCNGDSKFSVPVQPLAPLRIIEEYIFTWENHPFLSVLQKSFRWHCPWQHRLDMDHCSDEGSFYSASSNNVVSLNTWYHICILIRVNLDFLLLLKFSIARTTSVVCVTSFFPSPHSFRKASTFLLYFHSSLSCYFTLISL